MTTEADPHDDDVVIRAEQHDGQRVYVLHLLRSRAQVVCRSRDAAVTHARRYATQYGVRVWIAGENGDALQRLDE